MERKNTKLKLKLNDVNNMRDLLQETYNLADSQIIQAQQEMAKLASSTNLADCCMDEKQKYAKAMSDYLSIKDKAIQKKQEIAKQMADIIKFNGNINESINGSDSKETTFDFSKIKEMLDSETNAPKNVQTIELKKDIKNK